MDDTRRNQESRHTKTQTITDGRRFWATLPAALLLYRRHYNSIACGLMLAVLLCIQPAHAEWTDRIPVYYQGQDKPHAIESLQYAIWSWRERTGWDIYYAGETREDIMEGGIVMRWDGADHFSRQGWDPQTARGYAKRWVHGGTDRLYSYEAVLHERLYLMETLTTETMVHELGHALALSGSHLEDQGAVMRQGSNRRYALSTTDVLNVTAQGSLCHAELTRELDIYVPDIEGMRGLLRYVGQEIWILDELSPNPVSPGCDAAMLYKDDLYFYDLRSPEHTWYAELEWIGHNLWRLRYAE